MNAVLESRGSASVPARVGALDCTLRIPAGKVVGLVGPNGAGKSTLLQLAVGLLAPTTGTIEVLGDPSCRWGSTARAGRLRRPGHCDLRGLSVHDHLDIGRLAKPELDAELAEPVGSTSSVLIPASSAGKLSGGQRAQLALTVAIAKRPELLILDEPVASLDPLARGASSSRA